MVSREVSMHEYLESMKNITLMPENEVRRTREETQTYSFDNFEILQQEWPNYLHKTIQIIPTEKERLA